MTYVQELKHSARLMREQAADTTLPGYAEKMIHAAEELEKRAAELAQQAARELKH